MQIQAPRPCLYTHHDGGDGGEGEVGDGDDCDDDEI